MNQFRSIRRLALGTAVAAAAIGGVPAMANAASTCSYSTDGGGVVSVTDGSNGGVGIVEKVRIAIIGQFITVGDGNRGTNVCRGPAGFALTTNTSHINVNAKVLDHDDGIIVDQSQGDLGSTVAPVPGRFPESDGNSELEITTFSALNVRPALELIGTPGPDVIRVGGQFGEVNLGSDNDVDISAAGGFNKVQVDGGLGDDFITGGGNSNGSPGRTTVPLVVFGGFGNDFLFGGDAPDRLYGESDNDGLYSSDGVVDHLFGGTGVDDATADFKDTLDEVEIRSLSDVGRLRLTSRFQQVRTGKTARLKLAWKHPKAWRELRTVKLSLYRGNQAVGMISARPASGRLTGTGGLDLMSGSKLSHHGKWVTAKLALRLPKSLAGETLRLAVQATDRHGHKQLEPDAGAIHVTK
jgi:hypothetical protein